MLLEQFTLEEIFEECDITPERVLEILIEGGHIELPEFIRDRDDDEPTEML